MYSHDTQQRVRYSETDKMGYLYHGNYAAYFELGRVETIRSLGISYKDIEDVHGIWLPVMSLETRFIRPAYYDDVLSIHTEIRRKPDEYIVFHTEIFTPNKKLCAGARVKLCFFDAKLKKVVFAPPFFMDALSGYF